MKKIPSLFLRDFTDPRPSAPHRLIDFINLPAQWVADGEGIATVKWDGTACMVRGGALFKRYDRKQGKAAPEGWEPCQDAPDENTGHWPGWLPVGEGPEDKWHRTTFAAVSGLRDGTYELIGPAINGNPYKLVDHRFELHGATIFEVDPPRTFAGLRSFFEREVFEGIVWHHPDGRLVKIKRKDFGFPWPVR